MGKKEVLGRLQVGANGSRLQLRLVKVKKSTLPLTYTKRQANGFFPACSISPQRFTYLFKTNFLKLYKEDFDKIQ